MSSVMTTDHHERGYEAADWAIVRWYDMLPTIMGRGLPRRRATIRNVMTGEIRDIPLTSAWAVDTGPCIGLHVSAVVTHSAQVPGVRQLTHSGQPVGVIECGGRSCYAHTAMR